MDVTRQQLRDARHTHCGWEEAALDAALDARFPAVDPIDFATLCTSWADDPALKFPTLVQCCMLAVKVGMTLDPAFVRPPSCLHDPATALRAIAAAYP